MEKINILLLSLMTFLECVGCIFKTKWSLLKMLRSDRGGEYNSNEFDKFCEDISVERQVMIGFTPE
jgi:hypothetical protein